MEPQESISGRHAAGRTPSEHDELEAPEPTPGSDGDGAESGYTSPAELAARDETPGPGRSPR